jgi:alkylhydroperoxidase family enzyme
MSIDALDRFAANRDAIVESVLNTHGALPNGVRAAIYGRAAGRGAESDNLPVLLAQFVDKTIRHAYKVVDEDVERLLQAGYSEDAIYEAIVAVATGAGMRRIEAGMAAMHSDDGASAKENQ